MSHAEQPLRRRARKAVARPLTRVAKLVLGLLSWRWAQRSGALLGKLLWRTVERDRTRTLAHLEIAFPHLDDRERRELGRKSIIHLGVTLAECLHLARRGPEAAAGHIEVRGWEHVEAAREQAGLVLIAGAHCGNWELMGSVFRSRNEKLTALVRAPDADWLQAEARRLRELLGSETIGRDQPGTASRLLALRRRGGFLFALIDQDIRAQSVFVPFFGRAAHTPVGPARLALRWSMPVVPGFGRRLEDGSHRIEFQPQLPPHETEADLTAAITRAIELQIRSFPEQWVWLHRRWRRQPPGDTSLSA